MRNLFVTLLLLGGQPLLAAADDAPPADAREAGLPAAGETQADRPKPRQELFSGKVVFISDALKQRGITAYKQELDQQVALETADGELLPILPDWRGRAFYQDKRLRNRKVDLVGYRHQGVPYLQVSMVFTYNEAGERQYTDYWCDICAIPMYEIKPCDCCQGESRLRFQKQDLPDFITQKPRPGERVANDTAEKSP
jgi:hypothetical protein